MDGATPMMTVTGMPYGIDTHRQVTSISFITGYQNLVPKKATSEDCSCLGGGASLLRRMLSSTPPWLPKPPTRIDSPARRESAGDAADRQPAWPECGKRAIISSIMCETAAWNANIGCEDSLDFSLAD